MAPLQKNQNRFDYSLDTVHVAVMGLKVWRQNFVHQTSGPNLRWCCTYIRRCCLFGDSGVLFFTTVVRRTWSWRSLNQSYWIICATGCNVTFGDSIKVPTPIHSENAPTMMLFKFGWRVELSGLHWLFRCFSYEKDKVWAQRVTGSVYSDGKRIHLPCDRQMMTERSSEHDARWSPLDCTLHYRVNRPDS